MRIHYIRAHKIWYVNLVLISENLFFEYLTKIIFCFIEEIQKKLRMPAKKNASGGDGGAAAAKPKETKGGTSIKVNLIVIIKNFFQFI